jgi:hypothetical protein
VDHALPEAVRDAYRAEIKRLEERLKTASEEEAVQIRKGISDLEAELVVEDWPIEA